MMKGQEFGATQKLEREYAGAMEQHLAAALPKREVTESVSDYIKRLASLSAEETIHEAANHLAFNMVRKVNMKNVKSWRTAASKGSRRLHNLLTKEMQGATGSRVTRIIRENAALIKSVPRQAAEQLNKEILKAQQEGARPETVAKMARERLPQLLRSRIKTIARTQSQVASMALTEARCDALNLPFYMWDTSDDVRVRDSHRKMNGVVVPWAQPPAPELLIGQPSQGYYHAGGIYNCRCTQIVVLSYDDISFPARVYWKGAIHMMTKVKFKQLVGE